jgi:hypothetical protein
MKHTDYSKPMQRHWDPDTVFEINNPSTGSPTCVGQAVTCGRRCKRKVAGHRVSSANCIAHDLAELSPSAAAKDDQLYDIADSMLCYQHDHQAEELVSKWKRKLHRCGTKSAEDDIQNLYEGIKKLQEELRRMKAAKQSRSRKSSPFNNTSTEHSSKNSTSGQEDAETDTEETYKTKEDLREKQKREAKDRTEKAKEEARRSAQATKLAEEQKWSNAWSLYNAAWQNIELSRSKKPPGVPWPTMSGRAKDVNEASIQEFFQRAPGKTEDRFLLFSQEAKRWHTDKLLSRFGKEFVNGAEKENIDLVTRVIVQRWKEAKRSKAK